MSVIRSLHTALVSKQLSCRELTTAYLSAIDKEDAALHAYVTVTAEHALTSADLVDKKLAKDTDIPLLCGIPMALKDNICTKDIPTTCCSKMLKGFRPVYDATLWQKLKDQGAILLGKNNMDEFAMGTTCETSYFGGSFNPHNPAYLPGGSSGGSAAAVAGHLAAYALGSDTGGSIRQPSAWCGVVGLKPTYGGFSRYGLIAFASSFDQIGPITERVEDAAILWDALVGQDPLDATSCAHSGESAVASLSNPITGKRIGVLPSSAIQCQPAVEEAYRQTIREYERMGAIITEISLPALPHALAVYHILSCAEASANLGRYDGIRYGHASSAPYTDITEHICRSRQEGFGKEVQRRILLGTYVLSAGHHNAYYDKARRLGRVIAAQLDEIFACCDALLTPTTPMTAFKVGQSMTEVESYEPDRFTVMANIAGLPALSFPDGKDEQGLPIGLQLMGPRWSEPTLLQLAKGFEDTEIGRISPVKGGVVL